MPAPSDTLPVRALLACAIAGMACAKVAQHGGTGGAGGDTGFGGATGQGGDPATGGFTGSIIDAAVDGGDAGDPFTSCTTGCMDFPSDPFLDGIASDPSSMFTGAPTGDGPCITEPEDGALFPNNWLRPRVKFASTAAPGTIFEVRFHADKEAHDVVAYTKNQSWTLPKDVWAKMAAAVRDTPITISVRAQGGGSSSVGMRVAPVGAAGSIVYWAADPAELGTQQSVSSTLEGFAVGDESTVTALRVSDVQMQTRQANNALRDVKCIGCHNSTPDGASVAFIDLYPWNMAIAGVKPGTTGQIPSYVTPAGQDTIRQPGLGIFSFSKAHWHDVDPQVKGSVVDRVAVSPYYLDAPCKPYVQTKSNVSLAWLDLAATDVVTSGCPVEGKQFGIIARNGDSNGAANPTWSPDGKTIVYSSTGAGQDGRLQSGASDLWQVPYNDRAGGDASPLPGASDPTAEEYYPAFSPDSKLVVFDRVPAGGVMYANPLAELYVVRADGTTPVPLRLRANDPPKCSGQVSPGVNNHWAKWSPSPASLGGRTYYWLIFSSNRYGTPPVSAGGATVQVSQLYATAIVADETGLQMYPAIYLWNQHTDHLNTTPAWDAFQIPVIP
ncbi:MAG TPA: hypothetical protein VHJ20_16720 [Polyangia bacterium]|nr:hypothetical protein [Polyangia bacterium]